MLGLGASTDTLHSELAASSERLSKSWVTLVGLSISGGFLVSSLVNEIATIGGETVAYDCSPRDDD